MEKVLLTLLFGFIIGFIFQKLKITGGMMIGALVGSAIFNIITNMGYIPYELKFLSQAIAGAFIGSSINHDDLKNIKQIIVPIIFVLSMFLFLNLLIGFIISNYCGIDKPTAYMSAVPGGVSDIPIISVDFGANPSKVATMQFARLVAGIAIFPSIIRLFDNRDVKKEIKHKEVKKSVKKTYNYKYVALTIVVALIGGVVGQYLGVSGGVLIFSMLFTLILQIKIEKTKMPPPIRRFAQLLSGAFIGSTMLWTDVLDLRTLFIPIIILMVGYFLNCLITGFVLYKFFGFSFIEGMLSVSPAGASDMALIAGDMGIESPRLAMIQMTRLVLVIAIFPQVIALVI